MNKYYDFNKTLNISFLLNKLILFGFGICESYVLTTIPLFGKVLNTLNSLFDKISSEGVFISLGI